MEQRPTFSRMSSFRLTMRGLEFTTGSMSSAFSSSFVSFSYSRLMCTAVDDDTAMLAATDLMLISRCDVVDTTLAFSHSPICSWNGEIGLYASARTQPVTV